MSASSLVILAGLLASLLPTWSAASWKLASLSRADWASGGMVAPLELPLDVVAPSLTAATCWASADRLPFGGWAWPVARASRDFR